MTMEATPENPPSTTTTRTEWYPEQVWVPSKEPQIERNVAIMVFAAFIAGLLLGKIMNPVIIKH
jgi:hypothetical protein